MLGYKANLTGIAFPIKIVLRIAMALQVQSRLFASRAMRKRYMVVCNVIKEVDFLLLQHKSSSNRMHWSVTPSLIEETPVLIETLEIVGVGF